MIINRIKSFFARENVCDFLRNRCELANRFSEREVLHVLGALDVNSVRIHTPNKMEAGPQPLPGHALYALTALLSHSCIANSKTVLSPGYGNECIATVAIKRGEEITKAYCRYVKNSFLNCEFANFFLQPVRTDEYATG